MRGYLSFAAPVERISAGSGSGNWSQRIAVGRIEGSGESPAGCCVDWIRQLATPGGAANFVSARAPIERSATERAPASAGCNCATVPFSIARLFGSGPLELTGRLHPKTFDRFLYSFDQSLGVQMSFAFGRMAWRSRLLLRGLLAFYY